jgi:predicted DNA-binding helix-hairpin-helix protein
MRIRQWNAWFGCKKAESEENFNGYIHLKSIPGASDELMQEAALYADRLSVNLEIPTESGLKLLAPEKIEDMLQPMKLFRKVFSNIKTKKNFQKRSEICSGRTINTDDCR